jgi:hypothetical protein
MYQDLDILEKRLPSGGSSAIWTEINIGIEGYDAEFWGASESHTYWDTWNFGGPRFDIHFEIYSIESQKALLKLCNDLRNQNFVVVEETWCWIEDFKKFV